MACVIVLYVGLALRSGTLLYLPSISPDCFVLTCLTVVITTIYTCHVTVISYKKQYSNGKEVDLNVKNGQIHL